MNNFIENCARTDVVAGFHADAGPNAMLIQILAKEDTFPEPKYSFKEIYQFVFEDTEDPNDADAIEDAQAEAIAALLTRAREQHMNVIVHCYAGLCRSGAVVEVGVMLGFNPPNRLRIPNVLVKKKLMLALGLASNPISSAFTEAFYNREFD